MFSKLIYDKPNSWKDSLETLRKAKREYLENQPIMTEMEKRVYGKFYSDLLGSVRRDIEQGILFEYAQAIAVYQHADNRYKGEVTKEINRWDPSKLSAELNMARGLVDIAFSNGNDSMKALDNLVKEAQISGDIHKQRAVFEVLQGVTSRGRTLEDQMKYNRIALETKNGLKGLRVTEGMKTAEKAAQEALDGMLDKRHELSQVCDDLNGFFASNYLAGGPLAKAWQRVRVERETGKLFVAEEGSNFDDDLSKPA